MRGTGEMIFPRSVRKPKFIGWSRTKKPGPTEALASCPRPLPTPPALRRQNQLSWSLHVLQPKTCQGIGRSGALGASSLRHHVLSLAPGPWQVSPIHPGKGGNISSDDTILRVSFKTSNRCLRAGSPRTTLERRPLCRLVSHPDQPASSPEAGEDCGA